MTNLTNVSENEISFSLKKKELTQNEYEALIGLTLFLKSDNPFSEERPNPANVHPGVFCHRANELFASLDELVGGRFKCDNHLSSLQNIYQEAIANNPNMAKDYFFEYSQMMKLFVAIYSAQPLIEHLSGVFENLAEKNEFFEVESHLTNNQLIKN